MRNGSFSKPRASDSISRLIASAMPDVPPLNGPSRCVPPAADGDENFVAPPLPPREAGPQSGVYQPGSVNGCALTTLATADVINRIAISDFMFIVFSWFSSSPAARSLQNRRPQSQS